MQLVACTIRILVAVALFLWIVAVAPLVWILRDGMGSDAAETSGVDAGGRFLLTFWWGPILAALVVANSIASRWVKSFRARP